MIQLLTNPYTGIALLLLGSLLLPVLAPGSELLIGLAGLGIGASIWSWRGQNRWSASLAGVFIWTLVGLYIRGVHPTFGPALSIILVAGVISVITIWQQEVIKSRQILIGLATGIAAAELFLVLLFWPINFPSRALLIAVAYGLNLEVIEQITQGRMVLRTILPSLGISAILMYTVVTTADWLGM